MSKANPDYAASAVKMVTDTPKEMWGLENLSALCKESAEVEGLLEKTPEYQALQIINKKIAEKQMEIRKLVDDLGSYQDIENGIYAVKQRRVSIYYSVELVKKNLPQYSPVIISEIVDEKKLSGLIKGGLITLEQEESCIGGRKETFAYIIKV
jgi:hypothetical protein